MALAKKKVLIHLNGGNANGFAMEVPEDTMQININGQLYKFKSHGDGVPQFEFADRSPQNAELKGGPLDGQVMKVFPETTILSFAGRPLTPCASWRTSAGYNKIFRYIRYENSNTFMIESMYMEQIEKDAAANKAKADAAALEADIKMLSELAKKEGTPLLEFTISSDRASAGLGEYGPWVHSIEATLFNFRTHQELDVILEGPDQHEVIKKFYLLMNTFAA